MNKHTLRLIVALAFLILLGVIFFNWDQFQTWLSFKTGSGIPVATIEDQPLRLRIPTLKIDTKIQAVGLTNDGAMDTPNNYTDVGWYRYGPMPGVVGSAVIDGHLDTNLGLDAVFRHLNILKPGDDIYVDMSTTTLHFVVERVQAYPYLETPTKLIFTQSDLARLNLITCTGNWLFNQKTYDRRLVVYTTLADQS